MWIKNYTDKNLTFNGNGSSIVLTANATTLIPDGLTTLQELQRMFGVQSVGQVQSGPTTVNTADQQAVSVNKLYLTYPQIGAEMRLFVSGGTASVYGSDSKTIPSALTDMSLPEENEDVDGVQVFGAMPHYLAFTSSSNGVDIVITNCKLIEVKTIS